MRTVVWLRLFVLLAVFAVGFPAAAQQCSSDFQCSPSAGSINVCLGDTLIQKQRRCVAGGCQETEVGRISCGTGGGGTCQGNTFIRAGGRCDALSGRCVQGGGFAVACLKSCSCVGGTLTISTGTCSPGVGCGRSVQRCKVGCTCAGEPRCTKDPQPPSTALTPPRPALVRPPSRLPIKIAEPFEPGPPPRATAPVRKKGKAKRRVGLREGSAPTYGQVRP